MAAFNSQFKYPEQLCDGYRRMQQEVKDIAMYCQRGSRPTLDWSVNCRILHQDLENAFTNKTWEVNIHCDLLTGGRIDALDPPANKKVDALTCDEMANYVIGKFRPFHYGEFNKTDFRWGTRCRQNICTMYDFFWNKIRPRAMQDWGPPDGLDMPFLASNLYFGPPQTFPATPAPPDPFATSSSPGDDDGSLGENATNDTTTTTSTTWPWTLPVWPSAYYLAGCERISYFPFQADRCSGYVDVHQLCDCMIPRMTDMQYKVNEDCFGEFQKYVLFGKRGLGEGQLSELCAKEL